MQTVALLYEELATQGRHYLFTLIVMTPEIGLCSISGNGNNNVKPVISGTMHPVRELVISNMITWQTQSAPGTAKSANYSLISLKI